MPWMTQAEENALPNLPPCPTCKEETRRHYCRNCDEFYFTCGCPKETGHEKCEGAVSDRSYRY